VSKLSERQAHVLHYLAQRGVLTWHSLGIEEISVLTLRSLVRRGLVKREMVTSQGENDVWRTEPTWTLTGVDHRD